MVNEENSFLTISLISSVLQITNVDEAILWIAVLNVDKLPLQTRSSSKYQRIVLFLVASNSEEMSLLPLNMFIPDFYIR